jgi:hypothetical protein
MSLKPLGIEKPEEFGGKFWGTCRDYLRRNDCGDRPLTYRFIKHYLTSQTTTPAVEVFGERGAVVIGYDWKLLAVSHGWAFVSPKPAVPKLSVRLSDPQAADAPREIVCQQYDAIAEIGGTLVGFRGEDMQEIAEIGFNRRTDSVEYHLTHEGQGRIYRKIDVTPLIFDPVAHMK